METEKLLEYLGTVMDLEKNRQIQINTINSINNKIKSYQTTIEANNKILISQYNQSQRSDLDESKVIVDTSGKWFAVFGVYYCAFLWAIILGGITFFVTQKAIMPTAIASIIGVITGGYIPLRIWKKILKDRKAKAIEKLKALYLKDDVTAINLDSQSKQMEAAIPKLFKDREAMQKTYNVTLETLKSYYELNIIPVKYRSIIPVCMFYDYILNKRTYSLERNPVTSDIGAINIYEDEVFKRVIITKLNEAIHQLDMLRNEQKEFHDRMKEAQAKTDELLHGINDNITGFRNDVNASLDVIKYQNEQIANSSKYMSYIAYQRYMTR